MMMLFRGIVILALVCLAAALPVIELSSHSGRIADEYLVVLKEVNTHRAEYVEEVIAKMSSVSDKLTVINKFTALRSPVLHISVPSEAIMRQAFQLAEVESITANVREKMIEQCQNQNSGQNLWGLSRISSRSAPNYSGAQYSYPSSGGSGVRVYVLDTGIRTTHNDYGGRSVFGTNTIGGSNNDNQGHGTHCAGTVMGTQYGVSKGATSVAVKVLNDNGIGSTASIVDGVNWSVNDIASRGTPGVLSMSLGGSGNSAMDSAVQSAVAAGVPVIVAAGNENQNACNVSPARANGVVTVGATDIDEELSWYSNWGTCVDILAPGSDILSASHLSNTGTHTDSGTSMACPHVAGAVANYMSSNPSASPAQVTSYLLGGASQGFINLRGQTSTPNLLLYERC